MSYELSTHVTSNSLSAAFKVGFNSGVALLANTTLLGKTSIAFSGSWSDYAVLQLKIITRLQAGATSATASVAISTDSGATFFLSMNISATMSALQITMHDFTVMGGNNQNLKIIQGITAQSDANRLASTATATLGFINQINYATSATMGGGQAFLYGYRDT